MDDKYDKLIELLNVILGDERKHYARKGQIAFDCPHCSEESGVKYNNKGNFEINYFKGVYKCWACGDYNNTHGNLFKFFKKYGKNYLSDFRELKINFSIDFKDERVFNQIKLPSEYQHFTPTNKKIFVQAYNYLRKERKINDQQIEEYEIGFCPFGNYHGRIIMPSYDDEGDLNYFTSRTIFKRARPKYMNPELDKNIIFNEYKIDWNSDIYLVEGIFDHIHITNSIPLLGKQNEYLLKQLYKKTTKRIIFMLDDDAWNSVEYLYYHLAAGKTRERVFAVKMPDGYDIAKYFETFGAEKLNELKEKYFILDDVNGNIKRRESYISRFD